MIADGGCHRVRFDVAIVGGGSGGFGAAWAAARLGLRVVIVERHSRLGGLSTVGGVSCWEPGVGGTGAPLDLYRLLRHTPGQAAVYSIGRHFAWPPPPFSPWDMNFFPGGEVVPDPSRRYADTLRRHLPEGQSPTEALGRAFWHGVLFTPEAMAATMEHALRDTGRVLIRYGALFKEVRVREGRVSEVRLCGGDRIEANYWVDATGDGTLAMAAGAREIASGSEAHGRFRNGVTLIYRVVPSSRADVEPWEGPYPCWWQTGWPPAVVAHLPDGTLFINMLPTMEGREWAERGEADGWAECRRRIRAHWHYLQAEHPEFRRYRFWSEALLMGIRETRQIACHRILSEDDLRGGLSRQRDPDVIALADHPLDRHGQGGGCHLLNEPYGIPFRSLIPVGVENMAVACRAAGFDSATASSVRLSRTVMQMGQAVGTAAALAVPKRRALTEVDAASLREALRRQGAALEWPPPPAIQQRIAEAG